MTLYSRFQSFTQSISEFLRPIYLKLANLSSPILSYTYSPEIYFTYQYDTYEHLLWVLPVFTLPAIS